MAALTLTILGAGPAAPNPGGHCSGYLLRQGDSSVLVDCGSGIVGSLGLHVSPGQLRGVAISHFHADHYFDLVPLYYALKYGEPRRVDLEGRLPVYVPPGGRAFLARWGEVLAPKPTLFEDIFDLREYAEDGQFDIGGLQFSFERVQHYVMSHAMRIRAEDGSLLVFSSDVAPCAELIDVARGADVFLCESAMLDATQDDPNPLLRGHMSAAEAGQAAQRAEARRLLITHYRSSEKHDAHHLAAARAAFDGPVELAREGKSYVIGEALSYPSSE